MLSRKNDKVLQIVADYSFVQKNGKPLRTEEELPQGDWRKSEFYGSIYRFMKQEGQSEAELEAFVKNPALPEHDKKGLLMYLKSLHPGDMEQAIREMNRKLEEQRTKVPLSSLARRWQGSALARIWKWLRIAACVLFVLFLLIYPDTDVFQTNGFKITALSLLMVLVLSWLSGVFTDKATELWQKRKGNDLEVCGTLLEMEYSVGRKRFHIGKALLAAAAICVMVPVGLPRYDLSYEGRIKAYAGRGSHAAYTAGARHIVSRGPDTPAKKTVAMNMIYAQASPEERFSLCLMAAHMHRSGKDGGLGMAFLRKNLSAVLAQADPEQLTRGQKKSMGQLISVCDIPMLMDVYGFICRGGLESNRHVAAAFRDKTRSFSREDLLRCLTLMEESNADPFPFFALYTDGRNEKQLRVLFTSTDSPLLREAILLGLNARCKTPQQIRSLVEFTVKEGLSLTGALRPETLAALMADWDWPTAKAYILTIPKENGQVRAIEAYGLRLGSINDVLALLHEAHAMGGYTPVQVFPKGVTVDIPTGHFSLLSPCEGPLDDEYIFTPYLVIRRTETPDPFEQISLKTQFSDERTLKRHPSPIDENYDGNAKLGDAAYTVTLDTEAMSFLPMERIPRSYEDCRFILCFDRIYYTNGSYRLWSQLYVDNAPASRLLEARDIPVYSCYSGIVMYDIESGGYITVLDAKAVEWRSTAVRGVPDEDMADALRQVYFSQPDTIWEEEAHRELVRNVEVTQGDILSLFAQYYQ